MKKRLASIFLLLATFCMFFIFPVKHEHTKVNADTQINTGYENFMQSYFNALNDNIGNNEYGSCGYVAISMLLSYYDTYHDNSIIPEAFTKKSSGYTNNMINQDNFLVLEVNK